MPTTKLPVLRTIRAANLEVGALVAFPGSPHVYRIDHVTPSADADLMLVWLLGATPELDKFALPVGVDVQVEVFTL